MKNRLVFVIVAVLCMFAAGCTQSTPSESGKKTYTIYYEPGADATVSAASQTVTYGEEFTLLVPSRDGYVFCGWAEKETGDDFADGVYSRQADITLTAMWKEALKITLDVSSDVTLDTKEIAVYDGMSYTLPVPQKAGLTFVTWMRTDASAVPLTGTFRGSADVTYSPVWKRNDNAPMYAVKYDLGGVDAEISDTETGVDYGEQYTLLQPVRKGYAFVGWRLKGTETAFADGTYPFGWDVTVEAVWEPDEWTEIL